MLGATIPEETNVELAVDLIYEPLFHRLLHAHAPLSADSRARHDRLLGARFWGQVRDFPGWLRALGGMGAARRQTSRNAGKSLCQASFRHRIAPAVNLHAKEGVYDSSPSEGFRKALIIDAFMLLESSRRQI